MKLKIVFLFIFLFLYSNLFYAQTWKYSGIKYGVKGYSCQENGNYWFKGIVNTNASLSACCYLLRDANAYPKWASDIIVTKHLKTNATKMEYYTYAVLDFPWPMSKRDFILHGITTQNPATKVVSIKSNNASSFIPEQPDYVRLKSYTLDIFFSPINNQTQIEMVFFMGKADNFPSWLMDLFLSEKCYASLDRFAKMSVQAPYKTAVVEGIKN